MNFSYLDLSSAGAFAKLFLMELSFEATVDWEVVVDVSDGFLFLSGIDMGSDLSSWQLVPLSAKSSPSSASDEYKGI